MDRDLNQELADLTMVLMDSNQGTAAEITNAARNKLKELHQEIEDLKHKVNSLHWGNDTHQMGS